MKSVSCSKPDYASITCSNISNIPYTLFFTTLFNDSLILWDYLNLSLANEYAGNVTIPIQLIKHSQFSPGGSANHIAVLTSK